MASSRQCLSDLHDLVMLDLDGVVYVGGHAVPGAPEHLARARSKGLALAFITNNASRPPATIAAHLAALGIDASPHDVVTSAQAAARLAADRWGSGAEVLMLGADGLREALVEAGLSPVGIEESRRPAGVVTGYGPDVLWRHVMRTAVLIREGLPWIASNADLTIPTPYGIAPGHGVLVETLSRFAGVTPEVAGKPARPLLDETVRRVGGERPLMVGDRLDTDIAGAHAAGVDSLLVLTGVTGLAELVAARGALRPTYVAADLGGLFEPIETAAVDEKGFSQAGWRAVARDGMLAVSGAGAANAWWQVVARAAWHHLDTTGAVADTSGLRPPVPVGAG